MTLNHNADRAGETGATPRRWADAERETADRARQAAEALFRPKPPVAEPAASAAPPPEAAPAAAKPRVLRALRPAPTEPEASAEPVPSRRRIPETHFSRIRAWLKYGMTVRQVAEVYGVAASDIERLVQDT